MRLQPVLALVVALSAACVDRLPDQDRRILAATPVAKMPVADLAKDFQTNKGDATKKYWGKPIEVTGDVSSTRVSDTVTALIFSDKSGADLVEAQLLADQAKDIAAGITTDRHVRLKCYCDGLSTRVVLKSCVKP